PEERLARVRVRSRGVGAVSARASVTGSESCTAIPYPTFVRYAAGPDGPLGWPIRRRTLLEPLVPEQPRTNLSNPGQSRAPEQSSATPELAVGARPLADVYPVARSVPGGTRSGDGGESRGASRGNGAPEEIQLKTATSLLNSLHLATPRLPWGP